MPTKYDIILSYEESFARTVATRVIIMKPLTLWHYLIPFLILLDFIQRRKETETFTKNFLFTKKLVLDAALEINKGADKQNRLAKIEDEIRDWLTPQKLYSWEIRQKKMAEASLLLDQYYKLLNAEGKSYESLVKNAYLTRENYEAFLRQLTSVEKTIDRAVIKSLGEAEEVWQAMLTKQTVIDEIRTEGMHKLFSEAK